MKDQLISFKTAKLAKEKGFEPTTGKKYTMLWYNEGVLCNWQNRPIDHIVASTQSLLQKWLREVHNTHLEIFQDTLGDGEQWWVILRNLKELHKEKGFISRHCYKNNNNGYDSHFKTYEEALELGLQEALKLIK